MTDNYKDLIEGTYVEPGHDVAPEDNVSWEYITPLPWSQSNLPDLELVSETPFREIGGEQWYRWVLRRKPNAWVADGSPTRQKPVTVKAKKITKLPRMGTYPLRPKSTRY